MLSYRGLVCSCTAEHYPMSPHCILRGGSLHTPTFLLLPLLLPDSYTWWWDTCLPGCCSVPASCLPLPGCTLLIPAYRFYLPFTLAFCSLVDSVPPRDIPRLLPHAFYPTLGIYPQVALPDACHLCLVWDTLPPILFCLCVPYPSLPTCGSFYPTLPPCVCPFPLGGCMPS